MARRKLFCEYGPVCYAISLAKERTLRRIRDALGKERFAGAREAEPLPQVVMSHRSLLLRKLEGVDLSLQENKVQNLRLASAPMDGLCIRPGETFSFWRLVRYADRKTPYRDGLAEVNGKLTVQPGGGLCQLSNLLFWMFLHTPLTLIERHGQRIKDFPEPPSDAPLGVDATVAEGWLDLRVRNDTEITFQITVTLEGDAITGRVSTDRELGLRYEAVNENLVYTRQSGAVYEEVDVVQRAMDSATGICVSTRNMYRNRCEIGYRLPAGTVIQEKG